MANSTLVYVSVNGRLYPEKRPRDMPDNGRKKGGEVAAAFPLTEEEERLSLRELSEKYPNEKINEETG